MSGPRPGQPAPGFEARNQHGELIGQPQLAGRTHLLFFYPFAFSGICSAELRGLQERSEEFTGCAMLAISCDPMFTLRAYADAEGFGFDLLSDFWPHGAIAADHGVFDPDRGAALRGSFLVDDRGTLHWSVVNPIEEHRDLDAHVVAVRELLAAGR